eukprot:TRINITY_DN8877_c0_g1_i1.p1 TRINITY_DN8877_c0_g1~~TRINITY_DN8877_c0_g1_i1.p1  ORF type:complete len:483 (+),score=110.91 TRINITY_DN8877_c0_g1_i1:69-1451(+)
MQQQNDTEEQDRITIAQTKKLEKQLTSGGQYPLPASITPPLKQLVKILQDATGDNNNNNLTSATKSSQKNNHSPTASTTQQSHSATVVFNTIKTCQHVFDDLHARHALVFAAHTPQQSPAHNTHNKSPHKRAKLEPKPKGGEEEEDEHDVPKRTGVVVTAADVEKYAPVVVLHQAFTRTLLLLLHHPHNKVQVLALKVYMACVEREGKAKKEVDPTVILTDVLLTPVVENLLLADMTNRPELLEAYENHYLKPFDDAKYYTCKFIKLLCKKKRALLQKRQLPSKEDSQNQQHQRWTIATMPVQTFITSAYTLLMRVPMTTAEPSNWWLPHTFRMVKKTSTVVPKQVFTHGKGKRKRGPKQPQVKLVENATTAAITSVAGQKKAFQNAWIAFLSLPLSTEIYKSVLQDMDVRILPGLLQPISLMQFLSDSYDVGGVISLLALNGLFILISKHNLYVQSNLR